MSAVGFLFSSSLIGFFILSAAKTRDKLIETSPPAPTLKSRKKENASDN